MNILKQSTSRTLLIGPFLDSTDGNTAETGLTIAQADVRLSKNGGNMAQKNESTSCTHDELGYYTCPIDTTDTNTLGVLKVMVHETGALAVWDEFLIVTANIWDTLCSTDQFDVNITNVAGTGQTANDNGADINSILSLLDDARAEPGQGDPAVNPDAMTKLDYLYKAWRNKKTQTATTLNIYNDAGAVIDQTATVSDDGTTATVGELGTGA